MCLSSNKVLTSLVHTPSKQKRLTQVWKAVVHGCNAYIAAIENDGGGIGLREDFSKCDTSSELNKLLVGFERSAGGKNTFSCLT